MIKVLRAGMLLRLASGNKIRLVQRDGAEWLCVYAGGAERRGEVVFAGVFLRKVCTIC